MKKRTYAFALAAGLLLAGCASEAPDAPDNNPVVEEEGDGAGYITVTFPGTATRADGEDPETAIENAALVFYCEDGSEFTRYITANTSSNAYWVNTDANHTGDKCAIVKLQKLPVSVACVVNHDANATYSGDLNRDDRIVSKWSKGTGGAFYMSSSKYYTNVGEDWVLGHETPVTPEMLTSTKEDAANNLDHPLMIYVERYVAKVQVKNVTNDNSFKLENGSLNPLTGENVGQVKANVRFTPEFTFLTATTAQGYTIKKLPLWNSLTTDLQNWSLLNSVDEQRSSWVRSTTGMEIKYETLNQLKAGAKTFGTNPIYYAFDNNESQMARQTSVVISGKYTVTDDSGKSLAADDGTFYLVAFRDFFEVYKTEADAIKAMGGEEGDVLVQEGVIPAGGTTLPAYTDQAKWTGWTGWMEIQGKDLPTRCIKYSGGYGYYAKPLNLVSFASSGKSYNVVVRNHLYDVSIKGISGMGIGIPNPDQPIIPLTPPDPNTQNYYLHMSVKVQPWRTVVNDVEWK